MILPTSGIILFLKSAIFSFVVTRTPQYKCLPPGTGALPEGERSFDPNRGNSMSNENLLNLDFFKEDEKKENVEKQKKNTKGTRPLRQSEDRKRRF